MGFSCWYAGRRPARMMSFMAAATRAHLGRRAGRLVRAAIDEVGELAPAPNADDLTTLRFAHVEQPDAGGHMEQARIFHAAQAAPVAPPSWGRRRAPVQLRPAKRDAHDAASASEVKPNADALRR